MFSNLNSRILFSVLQITLDHCILFILNRPMWAEGDCAYLTSTFNKLLLQKCSNYKPFLHSISYPWGIQPRGDATSFLSPCTSPPLLPFFISRLPMYLYLLSRWNKDLGRPQEFFFITVTLPPRYLTLSPPRSLFHWVLVPLFKNTPGFHRFPLLQSRGGYSSGYAHLTGQKGSQVIIV